MLCYLCVSVFIISIYSLLVCSPTRRENEETSVVFGRQDWIETNIKGVVVNTQAAILRRNKKGKATKNVSVFFFRVFFVHLLEPRSFGYRIIQIAGGSFVHVLKLLEKSLLLKKMQKKVVVKSNLFTPNAISFFRVLDKR